MTRSSTETAEGEDKQKITEKRKNMGKDLKEARLSSEQRVDNEIGNYGYKHGIRQNEEGTQ